MGTPFAMSVDTRGMERALRAVQRETDYADFDEITSNSRTLLRAVAYNTPRDTGRGRAGWTPAWDALEMSGTPAGTRYKPGESVRKGQRAGTRPRVYTIAGSVDDRRRERGTASFAFTNDTTVLDNKSGRQRAYLYITNAQGKSAGWMQRAADEAEVKFTDQYEKIMRRHSA